MFISSVGVSDASFGGLTQADDFCGSLAAGASLGGTFLAWISDDRDSPSSRFVRANVPYRLLDGTIIANDWTDLVDGKLAHAIDVTENGAPVGTHVEIWTGTLTDGTSSGSSCSGWTRGGRRPRDGTVGMTQANGGWTDAHERQCGRSGRRIYCFEQ